MVRHPNTSVCDANLEVAQIASQGQHGCVTKPLRTVSSTVDAPVDARVVPPAWRVQSVDRAVHLLQAVANAHAAESGTVALGESCGLNRATAWRILSTLESHGLVSCDRATNQWTIGSALVDIVRASGVDAVLRQAHGVLEKLAEQTGETAALAVLRQGELVCVDEAAPASIVAVNWAGRTMSLHATSAGKVLLAWSPEEVMKSLLPRRLPRFSEATITDRASLREDLLEVRRRGYSTCRGEFDTSAWGVAAPVLQLDGRLLAVLSIWGPPDRIDAARFPALGVAVMEAARRLSAV
ncbi:MAG: IclR family transcriptional regulator [Marmoricola sp.]